jgi:hypothetical protein
MASFVDSPLMVFFGMILASFVIITWILIKIRLKQKQEK